MFSAITFIATAALLATAAPFPRSHSVEQRDAAVPANWWVGLENYDTYHERYMALDCEDQHNTTFFDACCHPLLKGESLESDRPAFCNPANDCADDNEPSEDPKSTPAAKPAPQPPVNVAPAPKPAAPKPPVNVAPAPPKPAAPAPKPAAPAPKPAAPAPKPAAPAPAAPNPDVHTGGFGTWFTQNGVAGACGTVHPDTAKIVALDSALYDNGAHCGQTVSITDTATQKTFTAVVADECPTCTNPQCLDMSTGLFQEFADLPTGEIDIVWHFV